MAGNASPAGKRGANDLEALWMPFTANRQFKQAPRMVVGAEGMYYLTADGRELLDGTSGMWCCNAGHARPRIVEAIARQAKVLDYAPAFQMGHPQEFELAARVACSSCPQASTMCSSPTPVRSRSRPA